jgi:SAM-dependent methyltransferase
MLELDSFCKALLPDGCILNKQKSRYEGSMEVPKMVKFYLDYATEHYRILDYNMSHRSKGQMLVQKKLCLMPHGVHDMEIFCYISIINSLYQQGKIPYQLDGNILTALMQKYNPRKAELIYPELKLKTEKMNSIDFYLTYVKDERTGKPMTLFNNSREDELKGQPYRVAHLHVGGRNRDGDEIPVPFMPDNEKKLYIVNLYLDNGDIRDMEGDPVLDETVIEAYYNKDPSLDDKQRWTIMRTRWDKTESVMRYQRRYGNNEEVAKNVWASIVTPFTYEDVDLLAKNERSFQTHMNVLRSKITEAMARQFAAETVYYAKQTKLMENQRNFHNFVKSIIIYPLLNPRYNSPERMNVLDFGIGRGGDLAKFFFARINLLVGIDPDFENIYSTIRGCVQSYKQMRRTRENVPPMYFIQADATVPFRVKDQTAILGNMTQESQMTMRRFFEGSEGRPPMVFDAINCQFVLHYMLRNETAFQNLCQNMNQVLRPGGKFLVSCFDGELVQEAMGKDGAHVLHYTDDMGSKKVLHSIYRRFTLSDKEQKKAEKEGYGLGCAIDVYNASFMNEGTSVTEYLVDKRFLIQELSKRCDMELVETGLFSMLYHTNAEFFKSVAPWEANDSNYLLKTRKFYDMANSEMDTLSYEITRLNRYYIFQKRASLKELETIGKRAGPEKRVPLKLVKEVPQEAEVGKRKPNKRSLEKAQKGGRRRKKDESSDSSSSSSSSSDSDSIEEENTYDNEQDDPYV